MKKFFLIFTSGLLAFTFFIVPVSAEELDFPKITDNKTRDLLLDFILSENEGRNYVITYPGTSYYGNSYLLLLTDTDKVTFYTPSSAPASSSKYDEVYYSSSNGWVKEKATQYNSDWYEIVQNVVYSNFDGEIDLINEQYTVNFTQAPLTQTFWQMVKGATLAQVKALSKVFLTVLKSGLVVFSALLSLILLVRFLNSVIY